MQLNTEWNKKEIKVVVIRWEHDGVVMSVSLYKVLCHWEKTESTTCAYHNKKKPWTPGLVSSQQIE